MLYPRARGLALPQLIAPDGSSFQLCAFVSSLLNHVFRLLGSTSRREDSQRRTSQPKRHRQSPDIVAVEFDCETALC